MEKLNFEMTFTDYKLNELKAKWQKEREEKEKGLTEQQIKHLRAVEYMKSCNEEKGNLSYNDCDICFNKGYIHYLDERDNLCIKDCECMKVRLSRQLIRESGIADLVKEKTFNTFIAKSEWQKYIKNKAMEYLKADKEWFLITGQSGSGKSHLCTAIVGQLLNKGKQVVYISYIKHIQELKQLTNNAESYNKILNLWLTTEILYIDDLFKLSITEADKKIVLRIIDYRIISNLKTIISGELMLNEMLDIDEATFGRLKRQCGEYLIEIAKDRNKNYRLKG